MKEFVSATTPDGATKIISAAALDYDAKTMQGATLSEVGQVVFNERGIVQGRKAKSGWLNVPKRYKDLVPGKSELELTGVNLWVNDGGKNWLSFSVDKASLDHEDVPVSTGIERLAAGTNRPFVLIDGKYKLVVTYVDMEGVLTLARPPRPGSSVPPKKK
jgi:hypothetical protein